MLRIVPLIVSLNAIISNTFRLQRVNFDRINSTYPTISTPSNKLFQNGETKFISQSDSMFLSVKKGSPSSSKIDEESERNVPTNVIPDKEKNVHLKASSDELGHTEIQNMVTNRVVESIFNEIFLAFASYYSSQSNYDLIKGLLVDASMNIWSAMQNYLRYRNSENWSCDEENCELLDFEYQQAPSPSPFPELLKVRDRYIEDIRTKNPIELGATVRYLIPSAYSISNNQTDRQCSPLLPEVEELASPFSLLSNKISPSEVSTVQLDKQLSPPISPPLLSSSLSSIAKSCMISILANLLSHQLLPAMLHFVEQTLLFRQTVSPV